MNRHGFTRTVAIDWSGAKGSRHRGIAIAEAREGEVPRLVRPDHVWSRAEVLEWLVSEAAREPTLFGFDCSFAPPWIERRAYLPGEIGIPDSAMEFWAYVDAKVEDEDLGAASFLENIHRRHFYLGAADGPKSAYLRFRKCEQKFNANGGGKTATVYDAIGAAQVAKASFAGMRLLHQLAGRVSVWPFEPLEQGKSTVVEIYSRAFIRLACRRGNKLRDLESLNAALAAFDLAPMKSDQPLTDHQTDAIVTAAGMLAHLSRSDAFSPNGLTAQIAETEGWTFGVT